MQFIVALARATSTCGARPSPGRAHSTHPLSKGRRRGRNINGRKHLFQSAHPGSVAALIATRWTLLGLPADLPKASRHRLQTSAASKPDHWQAYLQRAQTLPRTRERVTSDRPSPGLQAVVVQPLAQLFKPCGKLLNIVVVNGPQKLRTDPAPWRTGFRIQPDRLWEAASPAARVCPEGHRPVPPTP